jgi:hypothetical protein
VAWQPLEGTHESCRTSGRLQLWHSVRPFRLGSPKTSGRSRRIKGQPFHRSYSFSCVLDARAARKEAVSLIGVGTCCCHTEFVEVAAREGAPSKLCQGGPESTDEGSAYLSKRSETNPLNNPSNGSRPRHRLGSLRRIAVAARPAIRAYDLLIFVSHFVQEG